MEAEPDGRAVACALGAVHQGQGRDAAPDEYSGSAVVGGRGRGQEACAAQLHLAFAEAGPLWRGSARSGDPAGSRPRSQISARADPAGNVRAVAVLSVV